VAQASKMLALHSSFSILHFPFTQEHNMETEIITRTNLTCPECGFVVTLDIPEDY
jgi:hypothetical protein